MMSDLEKQLLPTSHAASSSNSRRDLFFNGLGVLLVTFLVCLLSAKIIVDIAIETTVLKRLQDHTLTIG